MKIALIASGASIHTVRWANALQNHGLEVHLITLHKVTSGLSPHIHIHPLKVPRPYGYYLNAPALRRRLHILQPCLVHAHYASGYGTLARIAAHRPLVMSVWGSDVFQVPDRSALHRHLLKKNLRFADWVCSTSHVMARRTEEVSGPLTHLSVTPFGVDVDLFRYRPRPVQDDCIRIGTVKKLTPTYGIDLLIKGFAACRQRLANVQPATADRLRLCIVGCGSQLQELEQLARNLGVAPVTEFVGSVPHNKVPERLNQLDIYVAVSRQESFGVAVVEASACELPVVVSDVGGLPEVVVDGSTGYVVRPEDPAALSDRLAALVLNEKSRRQFGMTGRDYVLQHYDWRANVGRMIRVYETVLARARADAA